MSSTISGTITPKAVLGTISIGNIEVHRTESPYRVAIDTTANWNMQFDYIPTACMLVVYIDKYYYESDGQLIYVPGIKIGDGNSYLVDLPFITSYIDVKGVIYTSKTTADWEENNTYVPKEDELIIYTDKDVIENSGNDIDVPGIKIGDGNSMVADLPFITDALERKINSHIGNNVCHITNEERIFWNNKLNYTVQDESLIFTRL